MRFMVIGPGPGTRVTAAANTAKPKDKVIHAYHYEIRNIRQVSS